MHQPRHPAVPVGHLRFPDSEFSITAVGEKVVIRHDFHDKTIRLNSIEYQYLIEQLEQNCSKTNWWRSKKIDGKAFELHNCEDGELTLQRGADYFCLAPPQPYFNVNFAAVLHGFIRTQQVGFNGDQSGQKTPGLAFTMSAWPDVDSYDANNAQEQLVPFKIRVETYANHKSFRIDVGGLSEPITRNLTDSGVKEFANIITAQIERACNGLGNTLFRVSGANDQRWYLNIAAYNAASNCSTLIIREQTGLEVRVRVKSDRLVALALWLRLNQ